MGCGMRLLSVKPPGTNATNDIGWYSKHKQQAPKSTKTSTYCGAWIARHQRYRNKDKHEARQKAAHADQLHKLPSLAGGFSRLHPRRFPAIKILTAVAAFNRDRLDQLSTVRAMSCSWVLGCNHWRRCFGWRTWCREVWRGNAIVHFRLRGCQRWYSIAAPHPGHFVRLPAYLSGALIPLPHSSHTTRIIAHSPLTEALKTLNFIVIKRWRGRTRWWNNGLPDPTTQDSHTAWRPTDGCFIAVFSAAIAALYLRWPQYFFTGGRWNPHSRTGSTCVCTERGRGCYDLAR